MAAREVIWSEYALMQRMEILDYWIERNGSTTYAEKLLEGFEDQANRLTRYPFIGRHSDTEDVLVTLFRDYSIYYHVGVDTIHILAVRDNRLNPAKRPF